MLMKLNFTLMKLKPLFAIAVLLLSYSVTLASDYVPGIGQSVHVSLTPSLLSRVRIRNITMN